EGLVPTSFFQADDGIRVLTVTGVQTCALPILIAKGSFKLQLGTVTELGANQALGGGDDTVYQAMALTLGVNAFTGASAVEVFIEIGRASCRERVEKAVVAGVSNY